jgi:hypothetical protein
VGGSVVVTSVVSGWVVVASVVSGSGSVVGGSRTRGVVVEVPGSVVGSGSLVVATSGSVLGTDSRDVAGSLVEGGSVVVATIAGITGRGATAIARCGGNVVTDTTVMAIVVVVVAGEVDVVGGKVELVGRITGNRSSLSVLSAPLAVNMNMATTPRTTTHAPAVAARIAPGSCHHGPGGGSYSGSNSQSSSGGSQPSSSLTTYLGRPFAGREPDRTRPRQHTALHALTPRATRPALPADR